MGRLLEVADAAPHSVVASFADLLPMRHESAVVEFDPVEHQAVADGSATSGQASRTAWTIAAVSRHTLSS